MMNPFTALKTEAVSLYHKYDGHKELAALLHRGFAELEAFVEKAAPALGAALGAAVAGPAGAAAGLAVTSILETEAPVIGAKVEQKVDAEIPK
jgi:hypothetical protein